MIRFHGVTGEQINILLHEAANAGDDAMGALCCRALDGSKSAWIKCARVIREAAGESNVPHHSR